MYLLEILNRRFSESELRDLCFMISEVGYDDLPGNGKKDKARELVSYLERRNRIPKLVNTIKKVRPDIFFSETTEAITDERSPLQDETLLQPHNQLDIDVQQREVVYPRRTHRGDILDDVADATIYIADANTFDVKDRILRSIREGVVLPTTYSYMYNYGFWNWIRLTRDPEYIYLRDAIRFYSLHSDKLVSAVLAHVRVPNIDFISLGPGDGRKDLQLLRSFVRKMKKTSSKVYYYPVDINLDMVSSATKLIISDNEVRERIKLKVFLTDFRAFPAFVPVYQYRTGANVLALLGKTYQLLE